MAHVPAALVCKERTLHEPIADAQMEMCAYEVSLRPLGDRKPSHARPSRWATRPFATCSRRKSGKGSSIEMTFSGGTPARLGTPKLVPRAKDGPRSFSRD